jgi:hypothetical protein
MQRKYKKYKKKYQNLQYNMDLKSKLENFLNSDEPYILYDTNLSNKNINFINSIKINGNISDDYNYFGKYNKDIIGDQIETFFKGIIPDNQIKRLAKILLNKISDPFMYAINKKYLWFAIRIQSTNPSFDINRWHKDGFFYNAREFDKNNGYQYKMVYVPKGPGTLFKKHDSTMNEKYLSIVDQIVSINELPHTIENRKKIAHTLEQYAFESPSNIEAAVFIVGNSDRSAVHSEPSMDLNNNMQNGRIFVSILPGDEENIKDLTKGWNKKFQN